MTVVVLACHFGGLRCQQQGCQEKQTLDDSTQSKAKHKNKLWNNQAKTKAKHKNKPSHIITQRNYMRNTVIETSFY
jgi:hypothetical protein